MPPGRNDPCYCGSGKKYKHCHLKEDRERERAEKATQPRTPSAPFTPASSVSDSEFDADHQPEARDPEAERLDQLYEEFEAAEYEEQISILRSAIEEAALDGELAFHFFSELYSHMAERDDREEFAELVALLQSNQPDIYAEENQWFWSWEITNALALDDDEALQRATNQLIQNGGQDLDQFFPAFNCLLYHDRREPLLQAMHKHTPQVASGKYFPGAEYEMKRRLGDLIVLH